MFDISQLNTPETGNVVLGAYVNGYSIVQELWENGVRDIIVMDVMQDVAALSNKISRFIRIRNSAASVLDALNELSKSYERLILYPNKDAYVEYLSELHREISDFCFLPFNPETTSEYQDKMVQYRFCEELGVPYPNVVMVDRKEDLDRLHSIEFPILIKPTYRDNLSTEVFRTLHLRDEAEIEKYRPKLAKLLGAGVKFVVSEIIPGAGSDVHSYTGYRSRDGEILGEWIGKKLAQFPHNFGVFASASNRSTKVVREQGRKLLHGMDLWGVNQPEFKYDHRDGKYKLTEINLRPMMWHRLGALVGVPLNYIQYLDAIGQKTPEFEQKDDLDIHYVYLNYEIINLFYRKNYFKTFRNNLFGGDKRILALWDRHDPIPFFASIPSIFRRYLRYRKTTRGLS